MLTPTAYSFGCLFAYRYTRLFINLWARSRANPIQPPESPTYTSSDVSVILPTITLSSEHLQGTLSSILATSPHQIYVVTTRAQLMVILKAAHGLPRITVLTVDHPNKREQLATAIPEVRSRIIILADDDVRWPTTLLPWILAPFERADVGAVGTCQSLIRPPNASWSEQVWAFLGAIYLERRNFDCGATNYIDGAVPCISGRTAAYRSQILKDESFLSCFGTETFMGRDIKHADDDNFKTRWVEDKGWKIRIQIHPEAEVKTYLERGWQYLYQCLRWSRSNWRSNLKTLGILNMWKKHPYSIYAVFLTTLSPPAFIGDMLLVHLLRRITPGQTWPLWLLISFMFVAKFVKLVPLLAKSPRDVLLLPFSIAFGWLHGLIKIHALLTITSTTWGNRAQADEAT